MSIRASSYARELLEHNAELTRSARLVLMLCAERANTQTAQTYTGGWLERAAKLHRSSVRRALYELAAAGAVALDYRPGKATVIRFPIAAALSTPGAPARAVSDLDLARQRATPGAPARDTPRVHAPRTGSQPCNYPVVVPMCIEPGCECGGDGWVHIDDGGRGHVAPCRGRSAPKAVGG